MTKIGVWIIGFLCLTTLSADQEGFKGSWSQMPDGIWVGSDFWANRLQDWCVRNGRMVCTAQSEKLPLRTVHLLTHRIGSQPGGATIRVLTGSTVSQAEKQPDASHGLLIGAGGGLDHRAAALIHHSPGRGAGLYAGINGLGQLFLIDLEANQKEWVVSEKTIDPYEAVWITLTLHPQGPLYDLVLRAVSPDRPEPLSQVSISGVAGKRLEGSIALVSHPGTGPHPKSYWFERLEVVGEKGVPHPENGCGPIISSHYTLSQNTLKITAQMMPLGLSDPDEVALEVQKEGAWVGVGRAKVNRSGYTATVKVEGWDDRAQYPYRLIYEQALNDKSLRRHEWCGTIRPDPRDKEWITVAAFTGNHNVVRPDPDRWGGVDAGQFPWDWGLWFPHREMQRHVAEHQPDLLFFSGDQVYEGASPTFADIEHLELDYLYKWYLWCWAFRDLTREIPTVMIPDDHDVFHGNIWGAGGVPTPPGLKGAAAQDSGGYKYSSEFVNMVERTQTSHLPDPVDPTPVAQGIGVYYTDMLWGGVSFAIVEDRKFKSAPKPAMPEAKIVNGFAENPQFDMVLLGDPPGTVLLGERQERFLETWAADWGGGAWMKVLLSQTIFANVATMPKKMPNGTVLELVEAGGYVEGDVVAQDMDSNGWPKTPRDRALRILRKGFAVHIAGDQHLGSTIQYGVDRWRDAGYALCVPSIANFWPRRWYPSEPGGNRRAGSPRYTGDYLDGFGNKMSVEAVSNPTRMKRSPEMLHDLMPGYGVVKFNRKSRTVQMENWPRWASPKKGEGPYAGWPFRFNQLDNFGSDRPDVWLPEVEVIGRKNPVIQVIDEGSGEVVNTIRINGSRFRPKVLRPGRYTIRVYDDDFDRRLTGVTTSPVKGEGVLRVDPSKR